MDGRGPYFTQLTPTSSRWRIPIFTHLPTQGGKRKREKKTINQYSAVSKEREKHHLKGNNNLKEKGRIWHHSILDYNNSH
jgi:hypothetical protein